MNQCALTKRAAVFCLLLLGLGLVAAFGGTERESSISPPAEIVERVVRARVAYRDRVAFEAYENRNAEIASSAENAGPPNPENPALLYYQAFLLRPEPNEAIAPKIHTLPFGTEPDRQVRTYLGHCLPVIEIVERASRMPGCVWGVWPERQLSRSALRREVVNLAKILSGDSVTLAADGQYRVALDRCLTVRRLARHLSGVSELYPLFPLSTICDQWALYTIQHVLGVMPPDADILTWFRGQLAVVEGAPPGFAKRLQVYVKTFVNDSRTNPADLAQMRDLLVEAAESEQAKESVRNLTDEQFLLRTGQELQRLIDRIFQVVDSEMTYDEKRAGIHRVINKATYVDGTDPVDRAIIGLGLSRMDIDGLTNEWYAFQVTHQAHINGIKAAVEVYLVLAETGQLPKRLPDHLPKDPFTGRDFVYETTDEGFALRCQGEEFLSGKNRWLEFKVRK